MPFIQTDFVADISEINVGGTTNNTITIPLTFDGSLGNNITTSFSAPGAPSVSDVVFEASVTPVSDGRYDLALRFTKPFHLLKPGHAYDIFINGNKIRVTIVYAYPFNVNQWTNIESDAKDISNIPLGAQIKSTTANMLWLGIFRTALAAWYNIRDLTRLYFYKGKYLNDILQFATVAGVLPENSTSTITYEDNNYYIQSVLIKYADGRKVRADYAYITVAVSRFETDGNNTWREVQMSPEKVVDSITVRAVKDDGTTTIKTLGKITYLREKKQATMPYAPEYKTSQSPISAFNQLSCFRRYETQLVTGYKVESN